MDWIYNYDWGVVNVGLRAVGLRGWHTAGSASRDSRWAALIFVDVWKWAGFNMIVCLAALHSLPSEVLEAAELDNCGWFAKLWFVIIPMIRSTLVTSRPRLHRQDEGVRSGLDHDQGRAALVHRTVSTYVYKRAFEWSTFDLGYPSAIASVWFAAMLACVITITPTLRQREKLEC